MKRTRLKSKEANKLLESYQVNLGKKDQVELAEDEGKFIIINGEFSFFYYGDRLVPTLRYLQHQEILRKISVNMGAVKFIVNGADVMRPGIVEIDSGIKKDDFVAVVDEQNKKPLVIGIALFDAEEMKQQTSGKAIKNIHYVGDEIWNKKA